MSRFTGPTSYNTGSIASGGHHDNNLAISTSLINVAKIKVVPSASTIGWQLEIYKKATRLAADRQYRTKTNVVGNGYDPTDREGSEVLEGWVLPYEDLDAASQLHIRWINNDPVARSADISIWYEPSANPTAVSAALKHEDLAFYLPAGTVTLASTPSGPFFTLFRNGIKQSPFTATGVPADYTLVGTLLTLTIPGTAGERLEAVYI